MLKCSAGTSSWSHAGALARDEVLPLNLFSFLCNVRELHAIAPSWLLACELDDVPPFSVDEPLTNSNQAVLAFVARSSSA
mmetsp:Transcript_7305/g.11106  ORF Transcript_7305/g.11106 Transcript_7305/m.11106 type:complete len:80 (-) Transcript_7305:8-247(-)